MIVLPTSREPRASILVAADRNARLLRACLESLAQNVGRDVPYEVVVVINGSPPDVVRVVREEVDGATVVESEVNRGVAGGYNLGRTAARGEFIVLLHDDVEVWPGWLEALVAAADETPDAGAVGSRALNPDGTLQSAGGVLHPDGTTESLRVDSTTRRAVDYSGSYALLVRAATWDAVDGLDERFFPAYHVDVDLGMKIRHHGQVVLYEPRAQVTHHRWGMTANERFRAFAGRRNLQRFVEKWQSEHAPTRAEPPTSDVDYLRLDVELKDAYIADLERHLQEAPQQLQAARLELQDARRQLEDERRQLEDARRQLEEIAASRTWRLKRFLTRLVAPSRTE